jgi:hypothetical protein
LAHRAQCADGAQAQLACPGLGHRVTADCRTVADVVAEVLVVLSSVPYVGLRDGPWVSGSDERMGSSLVVQRLRRQVDAAWPGDRARIGVDGYLGEVLCVGERLQDACPLLVSEVDVSCGASLNSRRRMWSPTTATPVTTGRYVSLKCS